MGWKATGETGKGVTVEEGEFLHSGCNGSEWKRMESSKSECRAGVQHLLPLSCSVVTFRRRRTRSSSVSPLSVSRDFKLRELVDLFSVSYSKKKAWETLWGQIMPCQAACVHNFRIFHTAGASGTCSASHPYLDQRWRDKPHLLSRLMSGLREMPWPCH